MKLNYKIICSDETREKLFKKLVKNPNYVLILNLDEYYNDQRLDN